ncbi:hypothetical protein GF385_04010 [Candidatus Dependentiae bacterium]|nr:hypothetical protein [Candidatus Dependentiae bacterium]
MKFNKFFSILVFAFISFSFLVSVDEVDDIDSEFYEDLQEELTDIIAERFWAQEQAKKYSKHIEKTTKRQIRKRVFNEAKSHVKNKVYNTNKDLILQGLHDKVFIYKIPEWPFYSQPFMQKNIFQVDVSFDYADQSFYSGGEEQDLSNLLFRQNNLTLKDILLVSRLMKEEIVAWRVSAGEPEPEYNKLHYLYILADQPLDFDACYNKQIVDLNFSKHLAQGSISVGFQIPVIRKGNRIKLVSDISASDRELLRQAHYEPEEICSEDEDPPAGPNFFERYGTLENFFIDILDQKGISFNKKDSTLGLGDLSLFFNAEIEWKQVERFFVGMNFVIPTSKGRDTSKLWDPEVGNGGFYYLEPFASVLFSEDRWFNPHAFLSLSFGLPSKVNRRVPKLKSYDGITPAKGSKATDLMIYGNEVYLRGEDGIFTDEQDAQARRFANIDQKLNIIPGPKIFLRIGNVLERFLDRNAFFDFYYDFGAKWKDYTRGWLDYEEYQQSIVTDNSWYFEHRIGASYMYQIDDHFRFNLGFLYTFAGINVEELFRLNLGLSFEF